jgi:hypothetical protein
MQPMPELAALRALARAAEDQLLAARSANVEGLRAATDARGEAQEALDLSAITAAGPEIRAEAQRIAMRVRAFDVRLRACGESVLAALASLDPQSGPTTYGRRGLLRSA